MCNVDGGEFYNTTSNQCEVCASNKSYLDETGAASFVMHLKATSLIVGCVRSVTRVKAMR